MIPFDDLCASLDRYNRRRLGHVEVPSAHELTHDISERHVVGEAHDHQDPAGAHHGSHHAMALGGDEDESTMAGQLDGEPLHLDEEAVHLDDEATHDLPIHDIEE